MKAPCAARDPRLDAIFRRLYGRFGPQRWWPAESPFEVIVGAVLAQNTSWKNVEKAVENLKRRRALSPRAIQRMPLSRLAKLIRPSGYFRLKARRLKSVVAWYLEEYGGSVESLRRAPLGRTRERLLAVWGVGPETADSILCYAAGKNTFVVDAYARRVLSRHGILPAETSYEEIREYFQKRLLPKNRVYNELHALIVEAGKRYCGPEPRCEECPLKPLLRGHPKQTNRTRRSFGLFGVSPTRAARAGRTS